ncbi:MAG: hypothetical protein K2J26_03200 [Ruminococcus sp.]|nr:hypothetical protein [Ruminococcus sp.]
MKVCKKISSTCVAVLTAIHTFLIPVQANAIEVESIKDPLLESYGEELGSKTDKFIFYNDDYRATLGNSTIDEDDLYYKHYLERCGNIELADDPIKNFFSCVGSGRCLGISIASILAHNKVFAPSDIQADRENLVDIQLDDSVLGTILSYQTRQLNTDFQLYMYWNLAHYTKEEKVDILLEKAKKATEQGKYFLIVLDSDNLAHAVTGIGMMNGEWEFNGEKYDKCVLTYDSNALHIDEETGNLISYGFSPNSSIFINSETKKTYMNFYYAMKMTENLSFFALDDENFMNFGGAINPADSYETDVSDINRIDIVSKNDYSLDVIRNNGEKYDGIASCDKVLSDGKVYFCDGKDFKAQNTENAESFIINFTDINHAIKSKFNGAVHDIFKNETEFGFDTSAATEYDVTLVLEEGSYDFTPHYRFDFSGVTDSDFKAVQTDRGIILSSTDRVKCKIKTSDVNRDGNGLVTSAEENVQEDAVSTFENVLLTFDESGSLKYYTGENYDTEVQKGDVNCDGFIDAVDATLVLESYAANSTDKPAYIGKTLGDYNGDGMVDAVDASLILAKYAELSTT